MCTGRDLTLLPESREHGCHSQKTLFSGMHAGADVLGLRPGCAHTALAGGGSRSDALGAGRRCLAPRVGGGRWSSPARGGACLGGWCASEWACGGLVGDVSPRGAESDRRGRLGWCGVRWISQVRRSGGRLGIWSCDLCDLAATVWRTGGLRKRS